jgi:L-ascorbate metabolism protein UlaG (beta-lactamase superfamily)
VEGINFYGFKSFHDRSEGRQRGQNTIFKIKSEDLRIVHLGDLGVPLTAAQVDEIGPVDILMVPVGGTYTVDAAEARVVVESLQPKIVIPMHYKNAYSNLNIDKVDKFTDHYKQVEHLPYLQIQSTDLTDKQRIVVLDYVPAK